MDPVYQFRFCFASQYKLWVRVVMITTFAKRFLLRPELLFSDQASHELRPFLLVGLDTLV